MVVFGYPGALLLLFITFFFLTRLFPINSGCRKTLDVGRLLSKSQVLKECKLKKRKWYISIWKQRRNIDSYCIARQTHGQVHSIPSYTRHRGMRWRSCHASKPISNALETPASPCKDKRSAFSFQNSSGLWFPTSIQCGMSSTNITGNLSTRRNLTFQK